MFPKSKSRIHVPQVASCKLWDTQTLIAGLRRPESVQLRAKMRAVVASEGGDF